MILSSLVGRQGVSFAIGSDLMSAPGIARVHRGMAALVDPQRLVAEYNLEQARVVVTQALTSDTILGHKAMATRCLEHDGQEVEYTVYESSGQGWHVSDYEKGWWEMPHESGERTGKFVFLLNPGEYDDTVDYWRGQPG